MMEVKEILKEEVKKWDEFVLKQKHTIFTQSSLNQEVAQNMSEDSWIFGVYKDGNLVGGSLVNGIKAKRGHYLVLPYGPLYKETHKEEVIKRLTVFLVEHAKENGYHFIRISPFKTDSDASQTLFSSCGYKKAPVHILAENTWLLNLNDNEEDLLKAMNKNHRNLIRRCKRDGVVITMRKDDKALERLNDMHDEVAKRHGFQRFSRKFIETEFRIFSQNDAAYIFEATLPNGKVDATAIIIFYGNMAAYRHSASLHLDKRLPTSYAIQWHALKEAKKRGIQHYNFWGIAPENATKKHPFKGITHFKKGFGGYAHDLVPCMDLPIAKTRYTLTYIFETLRNMRRGFQ